MLARPCRQPVPGPDAGCAGKNLRFRGRHSDRQRCAANPWRARLFTRSAARAHGAGCAHVHHRRRNRAGSAHPRRVQDAGMEAAADPRWLYDQGDRLALGGRGMKDAYGLAVSSSSAQAVAAFDRAIADYLKARLDTRDHLSAALKADPEFGLAHCLKGYFAMLLYKQAAVPAAGAAA